MRSRPRPNSSTRTTRAPSCAGADPYTPTGPIKRSDRRPYGLVGLRATFHPKSAVARRFGCKPHATGGELLAQPLEREVLALGLQHDVEVQAGGGLAHELLEGDRVDHVRVGAELREHPRARDAPADLAAALLQGGLWRRVMDLRADARRPRGDRELERLAVGDALRVVGVVVEDVPHHLDAGAPVELEDVAEREGAVVVLDHEPLARAVGEELEAALEALERGGMAARGSADVEDDDGLGPEPHGVHELALQLHVADRAGLDVRALRVQDDVLTRVGAEAQVQCPGALADGGELLVALRDLPAELRQVGMRRVRRERRRHPVHPDAPALEEVEDPVDGLDGPAQMRARLPAARIVGGQLLAEDLDGKAELHTAVTRVRPPSLTAA